MYRKFSLAFLLILLSLPCCAQRRRLPSGMLPDGMGVNIHFTHARLGEMEMLSAAGFRWVRMDFNWIMTEQSRGTYSFSPYDELVETLDRFGLRAIFILDYVNPLYDGGLSPHSEAGRNAYALWAAASARHFAGKGIVWEIYNEPNISPFWRPKPNVHDYVQLARVTSKAIKTGAPDELVAGPATSRIDMPFLEACFKGGLLQYWDAVTVHPYRSSEPETVASEYRALRRMMARYAPVGRKIPILSGEWGYSSAAPRVTAERQGKLLVRQALCNIANDVPLSIWYDWHDDGSDIKEREHNFGTVRNAYSPVQSQVYEPKPAYMAAKTLFAQLNGFTFNKRLAVGGEEDFALLFSKGESVRLVAWTSSNLPHEIVIPASPGKFVATVLTGDGFDILRAHDGQLKVSISDSPVYLSPEGPNDLLTLAASWERAPLEIATIAKDKLTVSTRVFNALKKPISVSEGNGSLGGAQIQPREYGKITHHGTATRDAKPQTLRLIMKVGGLGMLEQETAILVSNPLEITVLPRTRTSTVQEGYELPIMVSNPSGEAFSGILRIARGMGLGRVGLHAPVEFRAGEMRKLVSIPLSSEPMAKYGLSVSLEDKTGMVLLMTPQHSYAAVDAFWKYPLNLPPYSYRLEPDGDPKVASEQTITAANPPVGLPTPSLGAIKIAYGFRNGHKFLRLSPKSDALINIDGRPSALGLWVYGDASGDYARVRFIDSTGQTFQCDGPALNWRGWRYITIPLDGSSGTSWAGAADGVIHYPIKWDSIFLLDNASLSAHSGAIYISGPTLIY